MGGLVDPVAGWVAALLGDAWVGLLRSSPEERLVRGSMGQAIERVVARIDDEQDRGRVEAGLRLCFTRQPEAASGDGVRAAVVAQVALLRDMAGGEPGSVLPFYDTVAVEADWLESQVADAFVQVLEQAVAASGPAALVDQIRHEQVISSFSEVTGSIAELKALLLSLQERAEVPVGRVVGVVPLAADCFQEREAAVRIACELSGDGGAVLSGMGGVGKTQLAAAYARASDAQVVVWATAVSRPAVIDAYADAAARLDLPGVGQDPERNAACFLEWMAATDVSWLVILDDVQDPEDVKGLWPPADRAGRVLATTRRRDAALSGQGRRRIDVDLYTLEEARSYLAAKLVTEGHTEADADLDALAEDLGRLPLALAQAAAYLIDTGRTCAAYRELLADQQRRLERLAPEALPDDHAHIVAAAWSLSVERADQARPAGLARPMLELLSVLDPNGTPEQLFTTEPVLAHLDGPDHDDVHDALRVLHRFNLATHNPEAADREVRVHQLIQRATRDALTPDQAVRTAYTAADALKAIWPPVEHGPLGTTLRDNTTALTTATGDALWTWQGEVHPVLFTAANTLGETGQVHEAITACTDLLTRSLHHHGPDHLCTLTTRHNLAYWRGEAGDATGAATAFEELLTDYLRVLGPDHPATLAARRNLASLRGRAKDKAGAAAAFEELLADYLRVLGPDHPDTLTTRHNLARWRINAGDLAGGATAFEELLADYLRMLGPGHPFILELRRTVAHWWSRAGDAANTAAAFEGLLTDYLREIDSDHSMISDARRDVAYWRSRAGDAAGAAAAFEELLTDYLREIDSDHSMISDARRDEAYWRSRAGDAAGAAAAFEELLTDYLRVLSPHHRTILELRNTLAYWRSRAGDAAGAAAAFEELLTDYLREIDPDHPMISDARRDEAYWRSRAGDAAGAAAAFEELLTDYVQIFGPHHPILQELRNTLAYWQGQIDSEELNPDNASWS